jgi:hypothetical protein
MFDNILLESEQKVLLNLLVETSRRMPRDHREKLIVVHTARGSTAIVPGHPEQNFSVFMGDIDILAHEGLVDITYGSHGSPNVNVLPLGYAFYEFLKQQAGQPIENIETFITSHIDSDNFRQKYPSAYQKWGEAEKMLWGSDSARQLTTIGHLCREAVQEFATHLVEKNKLIEAPADRAFTVARIHAVLDQRKDNLGETEIACLDALLAYWGTVIDLIQREEHGSKKEGKPLVWEDGRRVVFQTAIVMFEIDRSLAG